LNLLEVFGPALFSTACVAPMDVAEALKSMNPDFKIMAVGSIGLKLEDNGALIGEKA